MGRIGIPKTREAKRTRRHLRVRKKVQGTQERPRLVVYRSLKHIYAQLVDDDTGHTLAAADSREVEGAENRRDAASKVGALVAQRASEAGIEVAVFDRGGNKYHGRIAALAEGAREGGLKL